VVDGTTTVYLPKNLESVADSPLAQAAIAACYVLQPHFEFSYDDHEDTQKFDKKQIAYLSGIAWALHSDERVLPPYLDVSGTMGHGYYWVCHHALEWHLKASTWWAKGSPWHPTKGLTGKAWSNDLDATTRSVNSLLSRAAHQLNINVNWPSWFRSKESFLGREIRKSLPHKGTALFHHEELQYLETTHGRGIQEYKNLLEALDNPTLPFVKSLAGRIKEVGEALKPLSNVCERVISHRITHVYPREKRARRAALKRPLKEVMEGLPFQQYIFCFDPGIIGDKRPFAPNVPEDADQDEIDLLSVRREYEIRVNGMRKAGLESLADLCSQWADNHIMPVVII
jgi:hypothetical protein